jgi:outer membrane receptor protein involved in Fe transport
MRFTHVLRGTASLTVLAACAAGAAHAQSAGDQPTSVTEIVVTAQKREQRLQDTPVVVTTLSQQQLQNAGVRDIKDMTVLTPGLTVTSTTNESVTTARIRGVGTVGDNPGLESSVGVVIDGVYRPRNGVGFGDLGEMQRIEVLKGPQGTLFGKNTSAGVINIITKAPSFTFGADGEATYGNYGAWGVAGSVTGPIVADKLAGRLYVAKRERDGFYDVNTGVGPRTETHDQDQNFWTARGQLLFQPSDGVSLRVIGDYSKREENCCVAVQTRSGPTANFLNLLAAGDGAHAPAPGLADLPFSRTAYANRGTEQNVTDKGLSLEANVDISALNATLTSISAVRSWEIVAGQDVDYSGADIVYRLPDGNNANTFDTFSQELRLAGKALDGRLDWLVGGFYAKEDLTRRDSFIYGADYSHYLSYLLTAGVPAGFGGPNPNRLGCFTASSYNGLCPIGLAAPTGPVFNAGDGYHDVYDQTSKTFALFTNETLKVTDAFDVTVGLRYTQEDKDVTSRFDNLGTNGLQCASALASQAQPSPANRVPAAALGAICLPWANPLFEMASLGPTPGLGGITHQSKSENEWSGTIKGQYRFSPNVMAYASFARGYKGGGFNLDRTQSSNGQPSGAIGVVPIADTSFPAEFVDSYEVGAKTTWLNGKLLLNATYFDQKFTDFQLNIFLGTSFTVESIPEVRSRGVDADFLWLTGLPGLTLSGGVTYADTKYGDFDAGDLTAPRNFPALSLLPGAQVSFAPKWSSSWSANYEHRFGGGMKLFASLTTKVTSEYNTGSDLLPKKEQEALTLTNGRIGVGSADNRWKLEFWAQNLTDEHYKQVVFNGPIQGTFTQMPVAAGGVGPTPSGPYAGTFYNPALDTGTYDAFLGQPRTYGVTLRVKY